MKNPNRFWTPQLDVACVAGSVLLHLFAAGLVLLFPPTSLPDPAPEQPILVEVLSSQQFQAVHGDNFQIETSTEASDPTAENATITPDRMLSATALDLPGNAEARIALSKLRGDTRLGQLCNIEAMEQISSWRSDLNPEWVVTSVRFDTQTIDSTYIANGAAFRHDGSWYDLAFTCEATPDLEEIVAFEFTVGKRIPDNQLERLGLFIGANKHDHD